MIVLYNANTGEIRGRGTGIQVGQVDFPAIEVPDGTDIERKRVDTSAGELVWSVDLSVAKQDKIRAVKEDARDVLQKTDWYVIREVETGKSHPQSVTDHRTKVRSLATQFEDDVNALETMLQVQNYSFTYPEPPEP